MRLFIYLVLFIVVVAFALTFSLQNPQSVEIHYYPDFVFSMPITILLLITLFLGVCIGLLATATSILRRRRELARIRKENRKLNDEIESLHALTQEETA
jgi:putative membrane protein